MRSVRIPLVTALGVLLLAAAAEAKPLRSSGFEADLASIAEDDTHHGYAAGKEAAELFRLSLSSSSAAGNALYAGQSLAQLRNENRRARAQVASARAAVDRSQHEGSAISLALNRKLAVMPESEECKCAHRNGWAVVTAARAQVLKEEAGAPADAIKSAADECPCRSALVSAVTQVLQEKLETLTEELGSRTSAALALQRALVSMRLPDALAGELTRELDQSLAKVAKKKTGVEAEPMNATKDEAKAGPAAKGPADAAGPDASAGPDAINVIVNNNMGDSSYNVTFSDVLNQSLPYFYDYKYPPAYVKGGQAPFNQPPAPYPWEGGDKGMAVVVNVNNYILPKYEDPWGTPCLTAHCFQTRASGKTQLRASKSRAAARQLQHAAAAAGTPPPPRHARETPNQRALEKKLDEAVEALRRVGGTQEAREKTEAATQPKGALEEERRRLVATARALEDVAVEQEQISNIHRIVALKSKCARALTSENFWQRRKAAAIREQGGAASWRNSAGARGMETKARMTRLFQLVPRAQALASGSKKVSEADVLSHVDEWEEAQRDEMHAEDGFHVLSPTHGDMAAANGRGYAGARENTLVGGTGRAGGRGKKLAGMSKFDVHSMLGRRGGLEEESDSEARNDLMGFYNEMAQHTKKKPLKHGPHNLRIGDGEARDDLGGYYDDEAAREGVGHARHTHDALYDLAVYGKARVKHALHRESAGQARSELTGFYKNLGRGVPAKTSPDRPRFASTGEARHELIDQYFGALAHEGRGQHTRGRRPSGEARRGDAVHGWESTEKARKELFGYFRQLSREGRHGHIKSLPPSAAHRMRDDEAVGDITKYYKQLDAKTRNYDDEERKKREVNVEGLSSASAMNDLDYFYDHASQGDADAKKLHTKPSGFLLPKV